jgi:hypothetical protein
MAVRSKYPNNPVILERCLGEQVRDSNLDTKLIARNKPTSAIEKEWNYGLYRLISENQNSVMVTFDSVGHA